MAHGFSHNRPNELENQLINVLGIISERDKDTVARARFWQPFLGGAVSVFVGSIELPKTGRHVIGEWDYRTVSELTSFFASIKETMEVSIQPPTFQSSTALILDDQNKVNDKARAKYVDELLTRLKSRNSIVIASADVNDMTEVALAHHAGLKPFVASQRESSKFNGIVAVKPSADVPSTSLSVYFSAPETGNQRGFTDIDGGKEHDDRKYMTPYISYSLQTDEGYSVYFAHIAKFRLTPEGTWILVLQGITGPATLGLALALTGGTNMLFTIFNPAITVERRNHLFESIAKTAEGSKSLASRLTEAMEAPQGTLPEVFHLHSEDVTKQLELHNDSVEALLRIYVTDGVDKSHDERLIIWWDIHEKLPGRQRQVPRS